MAFIDTAPQVKFPNVHVKLVGTDGNAFALIGKVTAALRKAKVDSNDIKTFQTEAMSGNYDHLLQVCMNTVEVS